VEEGRVRRVTVDMAPSGGSAGWTSCTETVGRQLEGWIV
jgi:hypothetical protein